MSNSPFYPIGVYVAEITAQALSKASTGTNQFVLRCKILGRPSEDGSYVPESQQYERNIYMALTEKTMPYVIQTLEKLGYRAKGFGPLDPGHPAHESFVGNQIDVYCKHEADQSGAFRERWQVSQGTPGLKVVPLSPREVRDLDALFAKALKGSASPSAKPATNASAVTITDEDIPF